MKLKKEDNEEKSNSILLVNDQKGENKKKWLVIIGLGRI